MKWISNFSGGWCSLFATLRTIERHGKENVIPLFANTLYESHDLYDANRRAEEVMGVPIVRIPICSVKLKRGESQK